MRVLTLFYVMLLGSTMSSLAQQTLTKTMMHNDVEREYILYIPASYSDDVAVPLVLNFHGYRFTAENQMGYGDFRTIADSAGFILVHPLGTLFNGNTHFNVGAWTTGSMADDVGFTELLLDTIAGEYNIDKARVYSTGFSNGGVFSFLLACQMSDRFAAVASVGGSMTPLIFNDCHPTHPTPILQVHGTDDAVIPYNGAPWTWPIDTLLQFWTEYNHGEMEPTKLVLPDVSTDDGSTIQHLIWAGGDAGTTVEHFQVIGGGHTWPGTALTGAGTNQDINASNEIWKFFSRYDLEGLRETTSIQPLGEAAPNIIIYPNPAFSKINIEVDMQEGIGIQLTSIAGEMMLTDSLHSRTYELELSPFPAGIYILQIGGHRYKILKK